MINEFPFLKDLDNIPGYFSINEAYTISKILKDLQPETAVEIGSLLGRSAFVISQSLSSSTGRLYCIDPFIDRKLERMPKGYDYQSKNVVTGDEQLEIFNKNMKMAGAQDKVTVLRQYSKDAASLVPDNLDFVFIDGSHTYEDALLDYKNFSAKLRPGGYLAFHDIYMDADQESSGPYIVVKENMMNRSGHQNPHWMGQILADCLFIAQKV